MTRLAHVLWFTYLRFLAVNSTYVCLRLVPPNFSVDCRCPLTIIFAKIKFMQNLKFSHAVTFDSKNSHYLFCDALQGLETVTFVSIVYFGHLFRQWQFVLASKSGGFFSAFNVHFTSKAPCNSSFSNSSLFFAFSISTTDLPPSPS